MVDDDKQDQVVSKKPLSMGGLMLHLAVLALAVIATLAAVVCFIPDQNDYAYATLIKHERLSKTETRKIVLIGGSNLSYGIDSGLIERETGCTAINMGLNGYFGPRYMMNEVKPSLRKGDIVLIAFEWDSFGKSVDGTGLDLFAISRANPMAFTYMTWPQRMSALSFAPQVAQAKIMRLIRDATTGSGDKKIEGPNLVDLESLKNFTVRGDLIGHKGVDWTGPTDEGLVLTKTGIDPQIVPLIKTFSKDMQAKGVSVVVSYTPTMRHYYLANKSKIDDVHRQLTSGPDAVSAPRPPSDYAFDESQFFDTVYHLKYNSRDMRTQQLVGDMRTVLKAAATCKSASGGVN